ncbi:MAG: phage major capsid protein [Oscillospiraceae bacterium]|nr:phage major capsid protein [Oscillospiraceae bacterium]
MSGSIVRENMAGLIPEPVTKEIFQGVVSNSAVLKHGRRLANMTAKTQSINVLDMLPLAYWVDGDTGFKKTSSMAWEKKKLYAEELAVIIPIPEAVLDDVNYDIWGEVKPRIVEAMGRRIDEAILFGTGKPSTWRKSVVDTAKDAGCSVTAGAGTQADPYDLYQDIMGPGGVIAKAEESGYTPTQILAAIGMRAKLRGLTDKNGQPIFKATMQEASSYILDGVPMDFPLNGAWDPEEALMIVGDFHELVYSIRQDVTYKLLTEATIVDPQSREIIYALAQQDMVALRCVMRLGWEIPNPVSAYRASLDDYSPFAVYLPAGD